MQRKPLILDLCGGTGSWSEPYREAGYQVIVVDPFSKLPGAARKDVRLVRIDKLAGRVHGILAAPPCTVFAVSGARWWATRPEGDLLEGLSVVDACLRIIDAVRPVWWALENPVGRLPHYIGPYAYTFQPHDYGDLWLKRTCIWHGGTAVQPVKLPRAEQVLPDTGKGRWRVSLTNHLSPTAEQIANLVRTGMIPGDWVHRLGPSPQRATLRSMTPPGFARAFFEANP